MPYENYDPYMDRRRSYRNDGESLINFSQFQPTFVGRPVAEIGGAYKSYREQSDFINNTEDILAQTLSQANVDPKDRAGIAERVNMLNAGVKDISEAGDFGPARIKLRNLYNKFSNDQFIPAATARYQNKIKALEEARKGVESGYYSPDRYALQSQKIENAFTPTTADINGMYDKEYIAPIGAKEFDFDKFLNTWMANKKAQLTTDGLYQTVDPDTGLTKWYSYKDNRYISEQDLIDEAVASLQTNNEAKPVVQDYVDIQNSKGVPTTEKDFLTGIATPYAQNFAEDSFTQRWMMGNYDDWQVWKKKYDYENQVNFPPANYNLATGVTQPNPLITALDPYNTTSPTGGSMTDQTINALADTWKMVAKTFTSDLPHIMKDAFIPGAATPKDPLPQYDPTGLTYDIVKLYNGSSNRDKVDLVLKNRFSTTLKSLVDEYIARTKSKDEVNKIMTGVDGVLKSFTNVISNDYIQTPTTNKEKEALNQYILGMQEDYPTIEIDANGNINKIPDLVGVSIYDTKANKFVTLDEFKQDLVSKSNGKERKVTMNLKGTYGADNSIVTTTGDYGMFNAGVYDIGDKEYAIGSKRPPSYGDILINSIAQMRTTPGMTDDLPVFPTLDSNGEVVDPGARVTVNLGPKDFQGRDTYTYTLSLTPSGNKLIQNDITTKHGQQAATIMAASGYGDLLNTNSKTFKSPYELTDAIYKLGQLSK